MEFMATLKPADLLAIAEAMTVADAAGKEFHIATGEHRGLPWVKYKVGYGMWSPPLYSKVYAQ